MKVEIIRVRISGWSIRINDVLQPHVFRRLSEAEAWYSIWLNAPEEARLIAQSHLK